MTTFKLNTQKKYKYKYNLCIYRIYNTVNKTVTSQLWL